MSESTPPPRSTPRGGTRHVVVIGGGPAAHRFVEAIVSRGADGMSLTVISEENYLPYDRVNLGKALLHEIDLSLGEAALWEDERLRLLVGTRAVRLDLRSREVHIADGTVLPYDDLVLATGSDASRLPFPGADHAHVYRTLEDVHRLKRSISQLGRRLGRKPRVVVIGGGLLGIEAAAGALELGAESAVVNRSGWLMNAQLDEGAGQALGRLIAGKGFAVHTGTSPTAVLSDDNAVTGVQLADGRILAADLVVAAVGITPRDELARRANDDALGLGEEQPFGLGPRGGVVISEDCSTGVPGVWAVGEVACYDGECVGLVAPANTMAEVVADRLHGGTAVFPGFDTATKLKLSGVDVASFGDAFATAPGALEIVYADPARGVYQKIVTTDDARTLLGGVFVGDAEPYQGLRPLLGRELPAEPGAFLTAAGGGAAPETELPDDAILCSCNNVSVGSIRDVVGGCGACEGVAPVQELGELKSCTRAGTQCGSCVPMLKKLLEKELHKAGVTVSKALCEHFELSRQELYDSIRVLRLISFEDVLHRYGSGTGCDICKPTVANILASQNNAYVLDSGRGTLQDTNDRALANMQKDGSYSVVPRIPGGEITPEKLAVIAAVAQKYKLYTKITGGQRIDLFGARLEQLPEIWKELIDAGMESGQAYGKSLRTVKSCVGSSWCRYGVQDSVGMAIRLELRYRGLRSPHKLKLGVSGCARECAEARGKDVGVIATADGWNLYVGGNGGATPAHAQLLAQDLDDETLISYIDRYFMYYIRTADRLQRTARWQEELDGGLDHVRQVVVEDSLGIASELESAMAQHVESYEDEWAATLKDPERLRRFRSFVNAPDAVDGSIVHVTERDQIRPATASEKVSLGVSIPVRAPGRGAEA
ncbi:nitrite reductase large subunit NirB [Arthrobacter sp. RCC_34]|uniref:nitrite reductase large subunit NirB n=1 Tax=Arthrobacter sp. RCC_34 TaxID=3239230 RepID=UPI003525017B